MKSENGRTKGLILWSFFTAIMIIVVCAAVLKFVFNVDFSGKTINETEKVIAKNESNTVKPSNKPSTRTESDEIEIVPTMEDTISEDTVWVPTFQLVWNDLMDELVKGKVEFLKDEAPEYLENLNAQSFKEENISNEYIYKKFGKTSNKLKEEILNGIKEKFEETSDIISESDDWGDEEKDLSYTFYAMLKRVFNFTNPFDVLDEGTFGDKYDNVKYFGIDEESSSELKDQVHVLYYTDKDNFAFKVDTKEGDELIFVKNPSGNSFQEVYKNVEKQSEEYTGETELSFDSRVKIPNLNVDVFKEYKDVEFKPFLVGTGEEIEIERAIQTVKLELDNEGGKIKSEALISVKSMAAEPSEQEQLLLFLNNEFTMFVKENGKDKPYFALNVSDISKYQDDVEVTE